MEGLFHGKSYLEMDDAMGYPYFSNLHVFFKSTVGWCGHSIGVSSGRVKSLAWRFNDDSMMNNYDVHCILICVVPEIGWSENPRRLKNYVSCDVESSQILELLHPKWLKIVVQQVRHVMFDNKSEDIGPKSTVLSHRGSHSFPLN